MTIPDNKKSKKKNQDQAEEKPEKKDGWHLANTIQLSRDQTKRFFLLLEQKEAKLHNIVREKKTKERESWDKSIR